MSEGMCPLPVSMAPLRVADYVRRQRRVGRCGGTSRRIHVHLFDQRLHIAQRAVAIIFRPPLQIAPQCDIGHVVVTECMTRWPWPLGQERNEGPFQVKGERPRNQELRSGFGYPNAASHSFTQAFSVKHASDTCRFACT
jgi:hypothetical protein